MPSIIQYTFTVCFTFNLIFWRHWHRYHHAYVSPFVIFLYSWELLCFVEELYREEGHICSCLFSNALCHACSWLSLLLASFMLLLHAFQACSVDWRKSTSCRAVFSLIHSLTHSRARDMMTWRQTRANTQSDRVCSLHAAGTFWTVHVFSRTTRGARRKKGTIRCRWPGWRAGQPSHATPRKRGVEDQPVHGGARASRDATRAETDELWPACWIGAATKQGEKPLSVGITIGFVAWQPPPSSSPFFIFSEAARESLS